MGREYGEGLGLGAREGRRRRRESGIRAEKSCSKSRTIKKRRRSGRVR